MAELYILVCKLDSVADIQVGALGTLSFQRGFYVYVGSAANGLGARVARHLRARKRLHWHIDYLLQVARVEAVRLLHTVSVGECALNSWVGKHVEVQPVFRGFGSSDCTCFSHLAYSMHFPAWVFSEEVPWITSAH